MKNKTAILTAAALALGAITYADSDGAAVNNNASTASEAEKPEKPKRARPCRSLL